MGRRSRRREQQQPAAPGSDYVDPDGSVLTLRGALTAGSRAQYAQALAGASAAATREDASARASELLFEHLAVRWVIAGMPLEGQRELLGRLRMASAQERAWVRSVLREHCAQNFPDVQVP